ncbi:MAG: nicotinate-nucleotide adenylyltransferase [Proteobacteria bacterium]|nr:nicotinate-nucleotide adenylyltransferase [Pseudomonadota bacterium]
MRVGLFGGSFDPAHPGHAHVAETARRRLGLHRVLWLVSPQNPLKPHAAAPLDRRSASARAQARGPAMVVSDLETRIGARYTVDTLRWLRARHPGVRFVWIMGGDNLRQFSGWRGWADILRTIPVAVVARPGGTAAQLLAGRLSPAARRFAHARLPARAASRLAHARPPAWTYLESPLHPASSTALRAPADAA